MHTADTVADTAITANNCQMPTRFQHTMATPQEIVEGAQNILACMKATASISIEDGVVSPNTSQLGPTAPAPKYPVIVIISGAAANGKDTFIEAVGRWCTALNLSSINEVKSVAKDLVEISMFYRCGTEPRDPETSMNAKDDAFRSLLHDIKMAWVNFCDGPAHCLYGEIRRAITDQMNGNTSYDVIFLHVREAEEITKIREYLIQNMGLIVLTVMARGLVDPSAYTNAGDRNVEQFAYDMMITNRYGMIEMWDIQAGLFAERLVHANGLYGIPFPTTEDVDMPPEPEQPQTPPVNGIVTAGAWAHTPPSGSYMAHGYSANDRSLDATGAQ